MDERQLTFRKLLFRISEKLSRQDLENLIFVCRDVIPVSRMERVRSATELFQALSERGKLAVNDVSYLARILSSIQKGYLLHDLEMAGYHVPISPSQSTRSNDYMFQECLVKVAQDLSSLDVEKLSFVLASVLHQSPDKIFSATQLFQIMQQRQHITATNLRPLYESLVEIGRKDVTNHINTYLQHANLPSYLYSGSQVNNG